MSFSTSQEPSHFVAHSFQFNGDVGLYHQAGQGAPQIHFAAANGFPIRSYDFFLKHLAQDYSILALENRGMWPVSSKPDPDNDWETYVSDLLAFFDHAGVSEQSPVVAIGHSLGGTMSLMAANRHPELFAGLILVDPATSHLDLNEPEAKSEASVFLDRMVEKLVESAEERQVAWEHPDDFRDHLESRRVYQTFQPQALDHYVQAGLAYEENKFLLQYCNQWEAHTFRKTPDLWPMVRGIKVPTLFLYGSDSFLYGGGKMDMLKHNFPPLVSAAAVENAGHLVFQDNPEATYEIICAWLKQLSL